MKKTLLPIILLDFENYLLTKNYSTQTISTYEKNLLDFFKFIKSYKKIKQQISDFSSIILLQVKKEEVIAYLTYINYEKNNMYATRCNKIHAIKCFYKWLLKFTPTNTNPVKEIPLLNKVEKFPKCLNLKQAIKLQTIFNSENCKNPIRNNTIIILFLSTGLRISELAHIKIKDINLKENTIYIHKGKGNKSRIAYFDNMCKNQLLKYINTIDIINLDNYLFNISIGDIRYICRQAFKLANISEKGYTPHTLRHTAGSILFNSTRDMLIVKEFLGHSTIASTEIYVHINNNEIRNAVNANPLNEYAINRIA